MNIIMHHVFISLAYVVISECCNLLIYCMMDYSCGHLTLWRKFYWSCLVSSNTSLFFSCKMHLKRCWLVLSGQMNYFHNEFAQSFWCWKTVFNTFIKIKVNHAYLNVILVSLLKARKLQKLNLWKLIYPLIIRVKMK